MSRVFLTRHKIQIKKKINNTNSRYINQSRVGLSRTWVRGQAFYLLSFCSGTVFLGYFLCWSGISFAWNAIWDKQKYDALKYRKQTFFDSKMKNSKVLRNQKELIKDTVAIVSSPKKIFHYFPLAHPVNPLHLHIFGKTSWLREYATFTEKSNQLNRIISVIWGYKLLHSWKK